MSETDLNRLRAIYAVLYDCFCCRAFSMEGDLYDYEKHFTVMNYQEGADLKQVR